MQKLWLDAAWEDYLAWQTLDKKTLRKINQLIQSIERNGYNGIGKPEPLRGKYSGWWSVRIDDCNRIVFKIDDEKLVIASCKGHYE